MSLFSSFDEVKRFIGADANNELGTLEPYFEDAVRDYLIPVLGGEEYDLLKANFPDSLTAAQEAILPIAQNVIANFGYYLFADDGTMVINDSGFMRVEHSEAKSAYQWQVREFKNRRWTNGWRAAEKLAKVLYANMSDYTSWQASEERLEYNRKFVWHTLQMKRYFRIDNWGTMWSLHAEFLRVQEDIISPMITPELYESVLDDVMTDSLSADNEPLLPLISAVQVAGVLKSAALDFGFEFGKDGLGKSEVDKSNNNSDKRTLTPMAERERLHKAFGEKYHRAYCALKQYLDSNSSADKYASYYNEFVNVEAEDTTDHNEDKGVFLI
jgi:hypothetical protein